MPDEETLKTKIFEFRSLDQVIAVVAVDTQTAVATMLEHGYCFTAGSDGTGFWLERIYDKVFDKIIVAEQTLEEPPAPAPGNASGDGFEHEAKEKLQAQTLEQFASFFKEAQNDVILYSPRLLMFCRHIKTKAADVFPVTMIQVLNLPQYKELASLCRSAGYRLKVGLKTEPLINEGLSYQTLYLDIKRKNT
ncbi:MAG: hypothetical protein WCT16_01335 [Candidatus Buchananbacteria bacterium]